VFAGGRAIVGAANPAAPATRHQIAQWLDEIET
jgi:hypothetical protein